MFYAVSSTLGCKGLFADGSFFFVQTVQRSAAGQWDWWWDDWKVNRLFSNVVHQLPLRLAIAAGVRDIAWLRWIFNAPLFTLNALTLGWIWLLSRRINNFAYFGIAAAVYVLFILPSDVFASNQARWAMGFYWVIFTYLASPIELRWYDRLSLIALGIYLFRSHETTLIVGPIFAVAAALRFKNEDKDRLFKLMIGAVGLAACGFAVYRQLTQPVGGDTTHYLLLVRELRFSDLYRTILVLSFVPTLAILFYGINWRDSFRSNRKFWLVLFLIVLIGAFPFLHPKSLKPFQEYNDRILITSGGPAAMILVLALSAFELWPRLRWKSIYLILAATIIAQAEWQSASLLQWSRLIEKTRWAISTSDTPLVDFNRIEKSFSEEGREVPWRYLWDWAWPAFGLAIGDSREASRLIIPGRRLENFAVFPEGRDFVSIPLGVEVGRSYFDLQGLRKVCAAAPSSCVVLQ